VIFDHIFETIENTDRVKVAC